MQIPCVPKKVSPLTFCNNKSAPKERIEHLVNGKGILIKFEVGDKNRCCLMCVKFHLNRCRFVVAVAKCLGGSLFWGHSVCGSCIFA